MKLRNRIRSDTGGAVTILGIALIVLLLLISVFMIDFVKDTQIKNDYKNVGQRATQAALVQQNGVGGLGAQSANALINEYMLETRGYTYGGIYTPTNGASNPYQSADTAALRSTGCQADNASQYPIIKISYDTGRHNSSELSSLKNSLPHATSVGGKQIEDGTGSGELDSDAFDETKYRTIIANITDISDNYFWGMFAPNGSCQKYHITVSAMATNSNDYQTAGK